MTELEKRLWICLMGLAEQVDEDCPQEYRTRHLVEALQEADDLCQEMWSIAKKLPT